MELRDHAGGDASEGAREETTVGRWTAGDSHRASRHQIVMSGEGRSGKVFLSAVAALILVAVLLPVGAVQAKKTCRANGGPGGDWPYYGRDISSTREQTAEKTIGKDNVGNLEPVWTFYTGEKGRFATNTVVSGTCLYFSDEPSFSVGTVYAVDINSGKLVWKEDADPKSERSGPWGTTSSVVVADGRVHVNQNTSKGKDGKAGLAVAFDAATGERLWTSEPISFGTSANQMSAPGVWNGVHFIATVGPDVSREAREGFAILDAATGKTLTAHRTIPKEDYERGYVGGGMWTNPAIDPETGYLYISSDNPNMSEQEHAYSNAILKIDLARVRDGKANPNFGEVVASYKGDPDNWLYPGGYNNPTCQYLQPLIGSPDDGWSPTWCGQLDVDMGGSPTLIKAKQKGGGYRLQVGGTQKSGTVHMAEAEGMKRLWTRTMTYPAAYQGNSGGAANDGKRMYVVANPGVVLAYDVITGKEVWKSPTLSDGLTHHPVTVANGVVYIISNSGILHAFDADTGSLLTTKSIHDGTTRCGEGSLGDLTWSGGVVIAHNTLFASCDSSAQGGYVMAFKLPG